MLRLFKPIVLLLFSLSVSAQVGSWENLSTLTEIRSILLPGDQILLASNGGILRFNPNGESFEYGIAGEQTNNLDLNMIYLDSDSLLWIGSRSPGPIVEVVDLSNDEWKPVEFVDLDEVNSFVQVGDSVYATFLDGLDGGLLLYRKSDSQIEYLDLFRNFPDQQLLDLTSVNDVVYVAGKLVFRTNQYILWIELDGSNLKDPANWNMVSLPVSNTDMSRLLAYGDGVLLAAGEHLYTFDFTSFIELLAEGRDILDLRIDKSIPNQVVCATSAGIFTFNTASKVKGESLSASGIYTIGIGHETVWAGTSTDFLAVFSGNTYQTFSANRPQDHLFNKMIIDNDGELVGGAMNGISIHGFQGWHTIKPGSYTTSFDETLYNWNDLIIDTLAYNGNGVIEDIIRDQQGNLYFAIQSRGVLKFVEKDPEASVFFNTAEGVLEPTYNSDTYILTSQMAVDKRDNVWLTTKYVQDGGNVFTILGADGSIYHIDQYLGGLNSRTVRAVAVDENNLVWAGSQVVSDLQALGGLSLIDYHGELTNPMDISVANLQGAPLGSNNIIQLEVDSRNTLWILTSAGVQSMPLPGEWLNSTELRSWATLYMSSAENDYWQLADYNVTGIEIDQRGNHWFLSSNAGLHVLLENGRWVTGGYNTGNSGLLDNEIYSTAFDSETGKAYFSTPKGVSILSTPFADPKKSYSAIHIYPQPFNPEIHDKVIIQGLMDKSSVKILTISGSLVKELTAENNSVQGYEAQWNGRDSSGDVVGSGVYILYLFNEDGEAASAKLAILR